MTDRRPDRDDLDRDRTNDLADHVDAVWDALVRGAPSTPDPLAPELTAEARRLHALDRAPHADLAFLARLREELTMLTPAPLASRLAAPSAVHPFPESANGHAPVPLPAAEGTAARRTRRWWGVVERAVAAVLVLGLIGAYVASNAGSGGVGDETTAAA